MPPVNESNGYNRKTCPRWKALNDKTKFTKVYNLSAKGWLKKFVAYVESGDFALLSENKEEAYVYYVRAVDISLNKIKSAEDFREFQKKEPYLLASLAEKSSVAFTSAERLKKEILEKFAIEYEHERKNQLQGPSFEALQSRFESNIRLKKSAPSPTPPKGPPNVSTPNLLFKPHVNRLALPAYPESSTPNNYEKMSNASFPLPKENFVTPEKLIILLNDSKLEGDQDVLFIDVRSSHKFNLEKMKARFLVNIDPLILSRDISSKQIEKVLNSHSSDREGLFSKREMFDLVVVFDEDSTRVSASLLNADIGASQSSVYHLFLAITQCEPTKRLKQNPLFLVGGFKAWKAHVGPHSILTTQLPSKKTDAHDMRRNALSPARSKPIAKTLEQFFRQSQDSSVNGRVSMQTQSPLISTPLLELQNPLLSPISCDSNEGSLDSFHSIVSPLVSPLPLARQKTVFDNPLNGFISTKEVRKSPADGSLPLSLESLYIPPGKVMESQGPDTLPPPLPPKPKSLKPARPCTPPLVSSLSYAMNIGTTGLRNLGNTCYMNSIIQCINGTIPLSRYFLDGSFKMHINRDNPLGYGGILVDAFEELVRVLWTEGSSYISPTKFKAAVSKASFQFKGNEQQDSQEFLSFLLDGLHEDLNLVKERPPPDEEDDEELLEKLSDQEASDYAWDKYLQRNNSIIVSLFQGQLKSRLQCSVCSKTSVTFNAFMCLSLPIPSTKSKTTPVHLLECLDLFVQEETLDGENAWFCPRCKCPRPSTKRLTISRLPDVLLIHLKRFSYDGPFRNKLDTNVNIPVRALNLEGYVPKSAPKSSIRSPKGTPIGNSYDLYAVSNHFGSLTGGHYTASVRSGFGGKWHCFDDSRVTTITEKEAVTKAAYNLFYVRTNSETAHL